MKGVAFFSGGKDGFYALYLAEKSGIKVPYLLALKTTIGLSPHWENLDALKTLAEAMGKELLTFDMSRGSDALAEFIASLGVDYLIAGDVLLEDHKKWVEWLAEKAGVEALEPLWGRNTLELAREMLREGFEWAVIAVDKKKLPKEALAYTFRSQEDLDNFLEAYPGVAPVGEFGEFHTVVLASPIFEGRFELEVKSVEESERYHWIRFGLVRA
ncbi:PAB0415 family putative ATP pyrophosphatase [Thermococcus pacificus]|uniref:ATP pyrophosphatase n=1 Tax=Thermococcus pacificus TaxID=71998 RepID=A0A218P7X0_9EURY|nr:diphthine--ammonia ligase [Thermococcus pacificus]ASJ06891.1 ATP pyrophosphatase [Thermococcus pacificus]